MAERLFCLASILFEPWHHQTWNDLGQVTNGCVSQITRTMHTDYVWHAPALVSSMWLVSVYRELKWLSGWTICQASLLSRATASNSCRTNIGLLKLFSDSTLYRKVAERWDILSFCWRTPHSEKTIIITIIDEIYAYILHHDFLKVESEIKE